jgi:hypothetical protein
VILCFVAAVCLLGNAPTGGRDGRAPVSLVASPAHVAFAGRGRQVVTVTSSGSRPVLVEIAGAGYGLDLRGRPRVLRRRRSWLSIRPRRLTIAPGRRATLVVASSPPPRAEPGDHSELVLLTTRPLRTAALSVRMRLGVVVVVRVAGRIIRRLAPLGVRVRARRLELLVSNRGNVTETIARRCVTVTVRRSGRVLARLQPPSRRILPHTKGLLVLPFRRPVGGRLRIDVTLSPGPPCTSRRTRGFSVQV